MAMNSQDNHPPLNQGHGAGVLAPGSVILSAAKNRLTCPGSWSGKEILRGVYPERSERAQNDRLRRSRLVMQNTPSRRAAQAPPAPAIQRATPGAGCTSPTKKG